MILSLALFLSLSFAQEHNLSNEEKLSHAASHILKEVWDTSELKTELSFYLSKNYKNLTTREERKVLGWTFAVTDIIINKEIKYEYKF